MSTSGRILRIEKLSTFDGDGLRTVIFLKGCPLRCLWCSTPESHGMSTDFGIVRSRCTECFSCVETCPEKAISYDAGDKIFITEMVKCTDCRRCIDSCMTDARLAFGYSASVDEILKEITKDSIFYYHSGGGVTISGGEPLLQKSFVQKLLQACVMQGINTAVETSGHVIWENIKAVLPFVDTFFYDLKHMDSETHKKLTGVGNRLIIDNLKKIDADSSTFSLVIRMPFIPTLNDRKENIVNLGHFCRNLKKLKEIQLLPYHRLGMETYRKLSLPYTLEHLLPPDRNQMEESADILREMGLRVKIGG